jgi:uncharacterized protein
MLYDKGMATDDTKSGRQPFHLLIKPVGADCNLRCDYCFYLRAHEVYAERGRHVMSPEVLETMVRGLLELRFEQSVFAWQGGEPTLAGVDFFRRVVSLQQKFGANGQAVSNSLQTNGLLLDESWCRLFRDFNFLIGLSIDGPEHVHDAVRKNAAGSGTWYKAMAAARLMDSMRVDYNVLCVVNKNNVSMGGDLLRWFIGQGFKYVQFIPCYDPGAPLNVEPDEFGKFLCDTFDVWSKEAWGKVSVRDFEALLSMHIGLPEGICTHGRKCNKYIVIEHDGNVYPCDFFVYDEWRLGNIMEAPLDSFMATEKYRAFAARKYKVAACSGCKWRKLCNGGCQKDRMSAGAVDQRTPFCGAYKAFFEHATPQFDAIVKRIRKQPPGL